MPRTAKPVLLAALLALSPMAGPALAQGDPAAGEDAYRKCKACHVADEKKNRVGPHLVGIIGREAGAVADFAYSPALENADIAWTAQNLDAFLADPKGFLPGNRMSFPGIREAEQRQNIIAYLRSLQ